MKRFHQLGVVAVLLMAIGVSGCASYATSVAEDLSAAILNQDDPELVREAVPAYLLLIDSMATGSPDDARMQGVAAQLFAAYGSVFVTEPERAKRLTRRSRTYGDQALCADNSDYCDLQKVDLDEYEALIGEVTNADALYSYALGNLAYIRAHSDDFAALTFLPQVEISLNRLLDIAEGDQLASTHNFLGILKTLRPAALGGKPDEAQGHFLQAIRLSGGRDLSVKVEYARSYARLVYDRPLHDRLLNEVLAADVEQDGYTLFNQLAVDQARILLASADDYF